MLLVKVELQLPVSNITTIHSFFHSSGTSFCKCLDTSHPDPITGRSRDTRDTSNLDMSRTPRRRPARGALQTRTAVGQTGIDVEQIAPPVSNSTPARKRRLISPIKVAKLKHFFYSSNFDFWCIFINVKQ